MPQISAYASFNREYDPQPGIVDESETETVGLRATLALYQGGALRSRIREARSREQRRLMEIRETRERVRQEVTTNWRNYLAAQAEAKSRSIQIDAATQALSGVREEARMGQRTVLDVLDAEQELIDAQADSVEAQRDETVALYALASSLGLLSPQSLGLVNAHLRSMGSENTEALKAVSVEPEAGILPSPLPAAKAPEVAKAEMLVGSSLRSEQKSAEFGPWR